MISKEISIKIGKAIKEIWRKNIPKDFNEGYIINEDCLKMALCYHLRRKLSAILKENDLRIYREILSRYKKETRHNHCTAKR